MLFSMLHEVTKHEHEILECTYKISKFESEGDRIYRNEIAYLFENIKDPIELIKWKDVLDYIGRYFRPLRKNCLTC